MIIMQRKMVMLDLHGNKMPGWRAGLWYLAVVVVASAIIVAIVGLLGGY